MIKDYLIFDDILTQEEQNILEEYVNKENLLWEHIDNITGPFGGKMYTKQLPGKVLIYENIDKNIISIIEKIQLNVCEKINLDYIKTYRCKINKTSPVDFEYNPFDLTHIDMKMEHLVIVYYINDSDGDTVILENIDGVGMENMFKNINGVNKESFNIIKAITPKKGTVSVFNGNLYHYGDYPKTNERFVINIDLAVKSQNTKLKKLF